MIRATIGLPKRHNKTGRGTRTQLSSVPRIPYFICIEIACFSLWLVHGPGNDWEMTFRLGTKQQESRRCGGRSARVKRNIDRLLLLAGG
jgi:hypothetical protein